MLKHLFCYDDDDDDEEAGGLQCSAVFLLITAESPT